jgi:hypothetical protein
MEQNITILPPELTAHISFLSPDVSTFKNLSNAHRIFRGHNKEQIADLKKRFVVREIEITRDYAVTMTVVTTKFGDNKRVERYQTNWYKANFLRPDFLFYSGEATLLMSREFSWSNIYSLFKRFDILEIVKQPENYTRGCEIAYTTKNSQKQGLHVRKRKRLDSCLFDFRIYNKGKHKFCLVLEMPNSAEVTDFFGPRGGENLSKIIHDDRFTELYKECAVNTTQLAH